MQNSHKIALDLAGDLAFFYEIYFVASHVRILSTRYLRFMFPHRGWALHRD